MKNKVMMWASISTISLMLSGLLLLPPMQGYSASGFNFPDFSSTNNLKLNRDAAVVNNALRLTPSANDKIGTAWFTAKQPVANGFETAFNFQITQLAGVGDFCVPGHTGADGIVFVVHNAASGADTVGGGGGGMGYNGIPNSIAVEFDTFCNPNDLGDPNDNHISIHTRGQNPNSVSESASIGGPRIAPVDMSNGQVHGVKIVYAQNTMRVSINGQTVVSVPVNLATLLSLDNGNAYVGFTSTTGAARENHDIKSWSFTPANTAPTAADDAYTTDEDTTLTVPAPGVLGNDKDLDGNSLTAIKVSDPANGVLTLNADGSFSYKPNANFHGTDSFRYKANDGTADSNIATVSITVQPTNDNPTVNTLTATPTTIDEEGGTSALAASATDPDGDTLTYSWIQTAGTGAGTSNNIAVDANDASRATFTAPSVTADETATIQVTVDDGSPGGTDSKTVDITVKNVNKAPVANDQAVSTDEDTALPITLTATDPDGDALTYTIVDSPLHGTLSGTAPDVTYNPAANYNGPDSFTFKANDGTADSNIARISITVEPINDIPTADAGDNQEVNERETVTLDGSRSSDPDGDTLTYAWTQTDGPSVTLSDKNSARPSFTAPEVDSAGDTLTFELTVTDNDGASSTADSVIVKVNNVQTKDATLTLSLDRSKVRAGNSYTANGGLIDVAEETGLPGRTITIKTFDSSGNEITSLRKETTTTQSGTYKVTMTAPSTAGTYTIQSFFEGDSDYKPAQSVKKTLTVQR